ncbi:MAG TPA: calcium-binding protein [Allosphingosinicella sp.]
MARIIGTAGNDKITGSVYRDLILGGDGNDTLRDSDGDDIVFGGAGDDILIDGVGNDELHGGDGNDRIVSTVSSYEFGFNWYDGGSGDDYFEIIRSGSYAYYRAIVIWGGEGSDTVFLDDTESSYVWMYLGDGSDLVNLTRVSLGSFVSITLGGGADIVRTNLEQFGTVVVEDFTAGANGDRLEFMPYISGLANFDPRTQNPFATGHLRVVQSGADSVVQVDWNGGGDSFVGFMLLTNVTAADLVHQNLGGYNPDGTATPGATLIGSALNDRLSGTMGADLVEGLGGGDEIYAGAGSDILRGGDDNDILYGDHGDDLIEGGAGDDVIYDGDGGDQIDGGDGNDVIVDVSTGGNDVLTAGAGLDSISITRTSGTGTVSASAGADDDIISMRLTAAGVTATLDAGSGDDLVTLEAIAGTTTLTLGTGADRVRLEAVVPDFNLWRAVTITDFETGDTGDMIDLNTLLRSVLTGWNGFANPFATGHLRFVQNGADAVLEVSRSADPAAFRAFLILSDTPVAGLTARNLFGWPVDGSAPPGFTLYGTEHGDTIEGSNGNDVLYGLEGEDALSGGRGADTVYGGTGNDTLFGAGENDNLFGGDGDDSIFGDQGSNEVHGGEGDDLITAGSRDGRDTIYGDGGDDVIGAFALPLFVSGGEGNDRIDVQSLFRKSGEVTILGGAGDDWLEVTQAEHSAFTIDMGSGNDAVSLAYNSQSVVTLGTGSDSLKVETRYFTFPPAGAIDVQDFATGDGGDQFVLASLFFLGLSSNPFASGHARMVQSGADTLLDIDRDGSGTEYGWFAAATFRNTQASAFNAYNLGFGTAGADTIRLDVALGLTIVSDGGNDLLYLGAEFGPGDYLDGGAGVDTVILQGDYSAGLHLDEALMVNVEYLALLSGTDTSFGGPGTASFDYVVVVHDNSRFAVQTLTVHASGLAAGESLTFDGSAERYGDFIVLGGAGADSLTGGDHGDTLNGGAGDDILTGGLGNDVYVVDSFGDQAVEAAGEGIDEIRTALGSRTDFTKMYTLAANVENFTGTSAAGQGLYANALDNVVTLGTGGDLVVLQDGGNDLVSGGGGDDFLFWGAAFTNADKADGGLGFDTVGLLGSATLAFDAGDLLSIEKLAVYSSGNAALPNSYALTMHDGNVAAGQKMMVVASSLTSGETLVFNGQAETDGIFNVRGGNGADTITGGLKADQLHGNLGADQLKGGGGNDVFEYRAATESTASARDLILDFSAGDRINLTDIDADNNAANGNGRFAFIGAAGFSHTAGELRVTAVQGGGFLVEGDVNGDGTADLSILVQTLGGHVLGASDFWL